MKKLSVIIILSLLFNNLIWGDADKKTVEEIIKNPGRYSSAYIETEGFIIQYVPETQSTTSYYILKGYYGDILKVNTAEEKPEINQKYKVWGILYMERSYKNGKVTYSPFLSEKNKLCMSCPALVSESVIVKDVNEMHDFIYIISGAAGLLILGFLAFILVKNKRKNRELDWENETITTDFSHIPKTMEISPYQFTHSDSDFKTIKINTTPSKTMRLIPGRLEVISGEDKGKTFLIQGYPTKEGSILTIGREVIHGERSQCHIQIDSKYKTVSRKQAEIIYKDKKLFVRNLSEINITEVNGHELGLGDIVEINNETIIKMGEIEFQYKI
jgi:hypothetical protein